MGWLTLSCQFFCLHLFLVYSQSSAKLCSHDQSSALLQFKQTFSFENSSSSICDEFMVLSYPKMLSWKEDSDCCSWDGVTCDTGTGHVIGLDLSCSWLLGNIPSNSSLFLLSHLKTLNLAYNDFNYSQISPSFSQFPDLTVLSLSSSKFSGQLPVEISHLSKLVSLDVSNNSDVSLQIPPLEGLVQNLTMLEELFLDYVDMSTIVPGSMTNLSSSLTSLSLTDCGLHGNFPDSILRLPNLQIANLQSNSNLTGMIPNVNWSSPLIYLDVSDTRFSGELSNSISDLMSLRYLNVFNCNFVGSVPASFGNLTQLAFLVLSLNNFSGHIPSSLANLEKLNTLGLSGNNFSGHIPSSLANLENLNTLDLSSNNFIGEIPAHIFINLTQLSFLSFQINQLVGPIPSNASRLSNLSHISFFGNYLSGSIPSWVFTLPQVEYIDLGYNQLTGHLVEFQSDLLKSLYLDQNRFYGSIPVLPHQLIFFLISNNKLTGKIPHSICNMSSIRILDLYNNGLSDAIPECIGNFSNRLQVLDLQKNRICGRIPDTFAKDNQLRTLNLNDNWLEGSVPCSLVNCKMLEVLDLGNNNINDNFPNWLESLPKLQILILRSNKFQGLIQDSFKTYHSFAKLRIFDLSNNNFTGSLPYKYFENLKAMMMNVDEVERMSQYMSDGYYQDSVIVTLKGFNIEIMKILTTFTSIDFSNNCFNGEIPKLIGKFHALRLLNLSHNSLIGHIPSSLGNLTALESLDLSSNKLVGEIPWQLTKLNFLEVLNLSQNYLIGSIPRSNQFDTFSNNSYIGNLRLCGFPLSNKCDIDRKMPQPFSVSEEDDNERGNGFGWQAVLIGYGCGMVFGIIMGSLVFATGKPRWLVKLVEGKHHRKLRRSNNKRGGRS